MPAERKESIVSAPMTAVEYEAAQRAEYGRYVANKTILIDGAVAFNEGDPVPVSHITRKVVARGDVEDTEKKG